MKAEVRFETEVASTWVKLERPAEYMCSRVILRKASYSELRSVLKILKQTPYSRTIQTLSVETLHNKGMAGTTDACVDEQAIWKALPHFAEGKVIQGFGRGAKQLGIPTANFDESVVNLLPKVLETGVYYGWARVNNDEIHKMVLSVGWNPFYHNEKRSMETHVLHKYNCDFYGSWLKVLITGYIRPERNFESLEALIQAIHNDIDVAMKRLELPDQQAFKLDVKLTTNLTGHVVAGESAASSP